MNKPELLAPVGGKPHLIAAVNNGADAVYMGGMAFNARIFADNFSDEELPDAINYAHAHGVKVYMTINTLVNEPSILIPQQSWGEQSSCSVAQSNKRKPPMIN